MIIHPVEYTLGPSKRLTIYQDTDTHIGSDGHDANLHRLFVRTIKNDPDARWLHTGDMVDEDRPSTRDRKFLAFHDRPEVIDKDDKRAMDELDRNVIPRYQPIADKCLGILDGDHYRIFRSGITSGQYIANALNVKYLGERMAYISVRVRLPNSSQNTRFDILARHGRGASSTAGGDVSALLRQNVRWDFDIAFGGHTHQENAHPEPVVGVNRDRTNFYQRIRWYIRGGSFLRGFVVGKQLYAEREEYGPLCIGWGQVDLKFGKTARNNRNLEIVQSKGVLAVS